MMTLIRRSAELANFGDGDNPIARTFQTYTPLRHGSVSPEHVSPQF